MHLLFSGTVHSPETLPIVGEISSDRDRLFICRWFSIAEGKKNDELRIMSLPALLAEAGAGEAGRL